MNKRLVHDHALALAARAVAVVRHRLTDTEAANLLQSIHELAVAALTRYTEEHDRMLSRLNPTGEKQ